MGKWWTWRRKIRGLGWFTMSQQLQLLKIMIFQLHLNNTPKASCPCIMKSELSLYTENLLWVCFQISTIIFLSLRGNSFIDLWPNFIRKLCSCRWVQAKPLPGVNRLIKHLHKHGVPFAVASNSIRKNVEVKVSSQKGHYCFFLFYSFCSSVFIRP